MWQDERDFDEELYNRTLTYDGQPQGIVARVRWELAFAIRRAASDVLPAYRIGEHNVVRTIVGWVTERILP